MYYCQECGHAFRTVKAAEKAAFGDSGCPKCGGSDIDLGKPQLGPKPGEKHVAAGSTPGASRVGAHMTAHEMALTSHNLSRDGMTARTADRGTWKWSDHFRCWACVGTEQ